MARRIGERLTWALERMAIQPDDTVLEVGCGKGVAVSLVCERLVHGRIVAIDRSASMIAAARAANQSHVSTGRARFENVALAEATFDAACFDTIFAVNVSLFWKHPARELRVAERALRPGGTLYVFHQPPPGGRTDHIADRVAWILDASGFTDVDVTIEDLEMAPAMCVAARLSSNETRGDARSDVVQHHRWLRARRATGRRGAGDERHQAGDRDDAGERDRVGRGDAVQELHHRPREREREHDA